MNINTIWGMLWNAQATRLGAFFHVAFLFAVTVALVAVQLRMAILDFESFAYRLVWIAGSMGWALRMLYLANREPDGSRQMRLARRGGVIIAGLTAAGVLLTSGE